MDNSQKTWHGVRAASLSVVAGVGHLYLGETRGYWIVAVTVTLIILWKFMWPPASILYLSWAIFSAVDAYGIAKRGQGLL